MDPTLIHAETPNTSAAPTSDGAGVGVLDALKLRLLVALLRGPMRHNELFRKFNHIPTAAKREAMDELVDWGMVVRRKPDRIDKSGPSPVVYQVSERGINVVGGYRTPDGGYEIST